MLKSIYIISLLLVMYFLAFLGKTSADVSFICSNTIEYQYKLRNSAGETDCSGCTKESNAKHLMGIAVEGVRHCPHRRVDIVVSDTIDEADGHFFHVASSINSAAGINPIFNRVILNSRGGNINAAMVIGRSLENIADEVVVDGECYSACVLVLVAAKRRIYLTERVGVHMISSTSMPLSDSLGEEIDRSYGVIEKYFRDNGVSTSLIEMMRVTPTIKIRILTQDEMIDAGLGFFNTTYLEKLMYRMREWRGEHGVSRLSDLVRDIESCERALYTSCTGGELAEYVEILNLYEKEIPR
ncbi:MAG: hypothetical protein K5872_22875 [Rhizobiaceae bacterium]|nr:hypothetical protein [Rhizobiaceae bacterium]MCV0409067.1 hypothetical protein [Rhizobiaceae bacterium]